MTFPDDNSGVSPQSAGEADTLKAIGLYLSPLGREHRHEGDIAEMYDLAERRLSDPRWIDFHGAFLRAVESVATGQETTAALPETDGADEFDDIPSEDDVPEHLRTLVKLIADGGLLANHTRIKPPQLLALLRSPRAVDLTHLQIWAICSPYWKVRLKRFVDEQTETSEPPKKRRKIPARAMFAAAACLVVGFLIGFGVRWPRADSGVPPNSEALIARIENLESLIKSPDLGRLEGQIAAVGKSVKELQSSVDMHDRLRVNESMLALAEKLRISNHRDEYNAFLASWSPQSFESVSASLKEPARWIYFRAGMEYFMAGKYDTADQLLEMAYQLDLRTPEVYMTRANNAKELANWDNAVLWLRRMLDDTSFPKGKRSRAANLLAFCLYQQALKADRAGRTRYLAEAEKEVERAIELAGKEGYAKAYVQRALVLSLQGKKTEAREALAEGKQIAVRKLASHRDARLYFTLSIIDARLGDGKGATEHLGQAMELETRDFPVSFWAKKPEPAFKELAPELYQQIQQQIDQVIDKQKFGTRAEPLPITVIGLLWDEDFQEEEAANPQAAESPAT